MQTLMNGDSNAVWNKLEPHGKGSGLDALTINDKAVLKIHCYLELMRHLVNVWESFESGF